MERKLIRPSLGRKSHSAPQGRRQPPPEATHAEASYLLNAMESKATLVVRLAGGSEIRGRVDFYDRDCIKLAREGRPGLLIRKEHVKYYWMEREPAAPRPGQ